MAEDILPQWAPRVRQAKIRQLYELDAQGIYDDELINEVGFALWARCQSFLVANAAVGGSAECPVCQAVVEHEGDKAELLHCDQCGWELSWEKYFRTIQHKQLSGAEPVLKLFQEFVERFPKASTQREKMFQIDRLLHGFHWAQYYGFTRPVAVNLIEGKLGEVIRFLDSLSYSEQSTLGFQTQYQQWVENSQNARIWSLKESHNK